METYEFEGKTTEEAIEVASRQLNLPVEELKIDIIEPGSAGIFGLVGGKKAKIRITVKKEEETTEKPGPALAREAETIQETDLALAKETLEHILGLIPVETTVNANQIDGNIALNIEGDKSGLLIGRKGQTLDALQFIVNKIVNKTLEKRTKVSLTLKIIARDGQIP